MLVISNSTPLIHLAKIEQLDLLADFYQKIIIPSQVHKEIFNTSQKREEIITLQKAELDNNKKH